MHVTETVESTYTVTSGRRMRYDELKERTERARVGGRLRFEAVSDVEIYCREAWPGDEAFARP